ncbi:12000_t:CDS:2, partial [Gigaspora rosea]
VGRQQIRHSTITMHLHTSVEAKIHTPDTTFFLSSLGPINLPASPDEIPNKIRKELPIVLALRRLYKFDKLLDNYFKRRYALPQDPQDLMKSLRHLFPITD